MSAFYAVPALVRAGHPGPCAVVAAGVTLLAVAVGLTPGRVVAVAAAVLAGQLSIGWSNDWFDAGRDAAAGRTDKPVASGAVPVRAVAYAALLAAATTTVLSLALGWFAGGLHLVGVAAGWLYNWPLKATAASVLPYLVGFGVLPGFVVAAGGAAPAWWLLTAGALLGAGAHFANVLSDFGEDLSTGVRGLPHRLGPAVSRWTAVGLLLATGAVLVFGPGRPVGWAPWLVLIGSAVALLGAILTRHRFGERLLFRVVLTVALLDVGLLIAAG
ncbi:MAG: UbiA family prenyltransferase [Micromonosporaceae bacterium]